MYNMDIFEEGYESTKQSEERRLEGSHKRVYGQKIREAQRQSENQIFHAQRNIQDKKMS